MTYDSLVNEGEYFPAFYLDEILPAQLKNGPLKQWTAKERAGRTPRVRACGTCRRPTSPHAPHCATLPTSSTLLRTCTRSPPSKPA